MSSTESPKKGAASAKAQAAASAKAPAAASAKAPAAARATARDNVSPPALGVSPDFPPVSMRELTALLIKHYDVHEGTYNLMIEFMLGAGTVGPDPANQLPGVSVGVSHFGLVRSPVVNANSVDASDVNPAPGLTK